MDGDSSEPLAAWPTYATALAGEVGELGYYKRGKWGAFMSQLEARMAQGQRDYGDKSFRLPAGYICNEWAEEALDVAGWGFVEWTKVRHIDPDLADDALRTAAMGFAVWMRICDLRERLMSRGVSQ